MASPPRDTLPLRTCLMLTAAGLMLAFLGAATLTLALAALRAG